MMDGSSVLSLSSSLSLPSLSLLPSTSSSSTSHPSTTSSIWHACQSGDTVYLSLYLSTLHPSSLPSELNLLNSLYETPLHVASAHNQLACVLLLLAHHPALNLQDRESGWTALHRSVYRGHLAIACALTQAGADPTVTDLDGLTAFDLLTTRTTPAAFIALDRANADDDDDDDLRGIPSSLISKQRMRRARLREEQALVYRDSTWRSSLAHLLYTFGSNSNYALGLPSDSHHSKPRLIAGLSPVDVVGVACTRFASFALTTTGAVYAWGQGMGYRLGTGEERSEVVPRLLAFKGKVVEVDAEDRWGAAVGDRGEVLVWGTVDFLWKEREMRREREREREERREKDDLDRILKSMPLSDRAEYQQQREAERQDRGAVDERSSGPRKDEHVFPLPHRLDSCRQLRVAHVCCSQSRLFLLTHSGELWYLGQSLDDGAHTSTPKRVLSMVDLTVSAVRATRSSVIVLSRGEVHQQVKGDRRCHRVLLKFSTFSTFSTPTHSASPSAFAPFHSSYSPPFSPLSPPVPSTNSPRSSSSSSSSRRPPRVSSYPSVVKLAVSSTSERAIAVTSNGEVYWWKILQEEVVSNTSPPLPSSSHPSYALPPFYLSSPSASSNPSSSSSSPPTSSSARGRRTAHLVPGLSSLRVVDVALGSSHTTVVTSLGDVYHWGNSPLVPSSSKPTRVHYLHQAARVWCSDQHVILSTVYHHPPPPSPPSSSSLVPSLRSMCEQRMLSSVSLANLLPALSFSISLSLPRLFSYALTFLLLNLNTLVHPAMKKLSTHDWATIERYYQQHAALDTSAPSSQAQTEERGEQEDGQGEERVDGLDPLFVGVPLPSLGLGYLGAQLGVGMVGEGDEKALGWYGEGEVEGEDRERDEGSTESDAEEGGMGDDGLPNLLAQAVHARGSEARREERKEKRRLARLHAKRVELQQRRREEEEQWRVGLSAAEVVSKLRSQLRALRKKERRRRETQRGGGDAEGETEEKRDTWIRMERIKGELRQMAGDGCGEAAQLLDEGDDSRDAAAAQQSTPPFVASSPSVRSSSPPDTPAASVTPPQAFDPSLSRAVRPLRLEVEEARGVEKRKGKGRGPSAPAARSESVAVEAREEKEAEKAADEPELKKAPAEQHAWGRSISLTSSPPSATPGLSLFSMIQREQEQAAALAKPAPKPVQAKAKPSTTSSPTVTPPPCASSPTAASASSPLSTRSPGAKAWGAVTPPSAAVPVLSSSPSPRPLSLAEIQQEEEKKRQRPSPPRVRASPASATILTPPTATAAPSLSTPAPFMLQLSDYIPTLTPRSPVPAKVGAPAPAKTWNVTRTTSPPSSSLRVIQAEEVEHAAFALPSSVVKGGGGGVGSGVAVPSVVWGRADVVRGPGWKVAVSSVSVIQQEEERKREEERALQEVEELQLKEAVEAERSRRQHQEARKAKEKERRMRTCAARAERAATQSVSVPQEGEAAMAKTAVEGKGSGDAQGRGRGRGGRGRGGAGGRGRGGGPVHADHTAPAEAPQPPSVAEASHTHGRARGTAAPPRKAAVYRKKVHSSPAAVPVDGPPTLPPAVSSPS